CESRDHGSPASTDTTPRDLSCFAVMLHVGGAPAMPLNRFCRRALAIECFRTALPSLSHPVPRGLARGVARKLGHTLAVCGVLEKFLGGVHQRSPAGEAAHVPSQNRSAS